MAEAALSVLKMTSHSQVNRCSHPWLIRRIVLLWVVLGPLPSSPLLLMMFAITEFIHLHSCALSYKKFLHCIGKTSKVSVCDLYESMPGWTPSMEFWKVREKTFASNWTVKRSCWSRLGKRGERSKKAHEANL